MIHKNSFRLDAVDEESRERVQTDFALPATSILQPSIEPLGFLDDHSNDVNNQKEGAKRERPDPGYNGRSKRLTVWIRGQEIGDRGTNPWRTCALSC